MNIFTNQLGNLDTATDLTNIHIRRGKTSHSQQQQNKS